MTDQQSFIRKTGIRIAPLNRIRILMLAGFCLVMLQGGCTKKRIGHPSDLSQWYASHYPDRPEKKQVLDETPAAASSTVPAQQKELEKPVESSFNPIGSMTANKPPVLLKRGEGTEQPIAVSKTIQNGDTVLTGSEGRASLRLTGGVRLYLAPSTRVAISRKILDGDRVVYRFQLTGKIRVVLAHGSPAIVTVETPNALTERVGDDFVVVYQYGITRSAAVSGRVKLIARSIRDESVIEEKKVASAPADGSITLPVDIDRSLVAGLEHSGRFDLDVEAEPVQPPPRETIVGAAPTPVPVRKKGLEPWQISGQIRKANK
ncbi:FecR family protein, partial [bacterium]|nr:FecR family protein [bacterium]